MAILNGTNKADKLTGTAQTDCIFGGNGNDIDQRRRRRRLYRSASNGSDLISGGAGNDVIDGGNGQDTLVLTGNRSDYRIHARPHRRRSSSATCAPVAPTARTG